MESLLFSNIISEKTHYGVIWGGNFKGFPDMPHFEI